MHPVFFLMSSMVKPSAISFRVILPLLEKSKTACSVTIMLTQLAPVKASKIPTFLHSFKGKGYIFYRLQPDFFVLKPLSGLICYANIHCTKAELSRYNSLTPTHPAPDLPTLVQQLPQRKLQKELRGRTANFLFKILQGILR